MVQLSTVPLSGRDAQEVETGRSGPTKGRRAPRESGTHQSVPRWVMVGTLDKQAIPLHPRGPVNRSLGDITASLPLRTQNSIHPTTPISACRPLSGGLASSTGPHCLLHRPRHLPLQKLWTGCRPVPCPSLHRPWHRTSCWGGFKRHVREAASSEKGRAGEQAESPAHRSSRGP